MGGKHEWGGHGTTTNATSKSFGTGKSNTSTIVSALGTNGGVDYAARLCDQYSKFYNEVTYSDWYLPSYGELVELRNQKTIVGGFTSSWYWSSSESSHLSAWRVYFGGTNHYAGEKTLLYGVRPIRQF